MNTMNSRIKTRMIYHVDRPTLLRTIRRKTPVVLEIQIPEHFLAAVASPGMRSIGGCK